MRTYYGSNIQPGKHPWHNDHLSLAKSAFVQTVRCCRAACRPCVMATVLTIQLVDSPANYERPLTTSPHRSTMTRFNWVRRFVFDLRYFVMMYSVPGSASSNSLCVSGLGHTNNDRTMVRGKTPLELPVINFVSQYFQVWAGKDEVDAAICYHRFPKPVPA